MGGSDGLVGDLRAQLARGQALVVVGAGVAVAATGGHPVASWTGLLESGVQWCEEYVAGLPPGWADLVRGFVGLGDVPSLLSAAEAVTERLGGRGGGEYRRWLRETVGALRVVDPSVGQALAGLEVPVATTNYDGLLEQAMTGRGSVTWRDGARILRVLRADEAAVLHLHGFWDEPESVVLGIRSYEAVLGAAAAQALERAITTMRSLVLVGVGTGADDPNFRALRVWLASTFPDNEYRHFRLCRDDEVPAVAAEHAAERILPVAYGASHNELARFLRSLASRPARVSPPADARPRVLDPVDGLSPEEATELLGRLAGPNRSRAEPKAAAELVRLCGYLPLAVSIVGAHLATVPIMSIADFVDRLTAEERRLVETSASDVEVRAAFTLSYQTLADNARMMIRRLALIAGADFGLGAAAALGEVPFVTAEALLDTLVEAQLLQHDPASSRYRFHDLLRFYAREQARVDEPELSRREAVQRLLTWYLDTAHVAGELLIPGRRRLPYEPERQWPGPTFAASGQALAWCESERASLVAAVRQAKDHRLNETAWQLADALFGFFSLRKHWTDWQETHEVGLLAAYQEEDQLAKAAMLAGLGHVHRELGHVEAAEDNYERSLNISRRTGDRRGEARAVSGLAHAYREQGEFEKAIGPYLQTLKLRRQEGDRYHEGVTLSNLGQVHAGMKKFDEAFNYYSRALDIQREIGARYPEGFTQRNVGEAKYQQGKYEERDAGCRQERYDEAIEACKESLRILREIGHRHGQALALDSLGKVFKDKTELAEARACWREALGIFTDLGAREAEGVGRRLRAAED